MLGPPLFFMNLLILNLFFNFNCLNMDILLNMYTLVITFYTGMLNMPLEGSVSQIFDLGPGNFWPFFKTLFLRFHKIKTRT